MSTQAQFHQTEKMLTHMKFDGPMETTILKHWRTYEPKLVEELVSRQMLKKTLMQRANDLLDLQISLEKTERLPPALAAMEAWRILMKPSTPDKEEEERIGEMDM